MKKSKQKTHKKQSKQPTRKRGFTLIEILVASTIIIIVSAIGLVSYSSAQVNARDAKRVKDLENVRTVLLLYRVENGEYPIAEVPGASRVAFSFPRRIVARLTSAFVAPGVQVVQGFNDDSGGPSFTPNPTASPGVGIDPVSTPTPSPSGGGISPTPTPTPPSAPPGNADAYQTMTAGLVSAGYMQSSQVPVDPINNATYYYGYNSDGFYFELTARLEKDGSVLTLTD